MPLVAVRDGEEALRPRFVGGGLVTVVGNATADPSCEFVPAIAATGRWRIQQAAVGTVHDVLVSRGPSKVNAGGGLF